MPYKPGQTNVGGCRRPPRRDPPIAKPLTPEPAPPRTILIVDDERDILESLGDLFRASLPGVRCLAASSGEEALKALGKEQVDLIVSDFKMPGMNGLEFLEKARDLAPQVPRIMMTAFPDLDVAISAINEARIETFFTKPLDPDKVLAVVADALERRRARGARDRSMARALDEMRRRLGGEADK